MIAPFLVKEERQTVDGIEGGPQVAQMSFPPAILQHPEPGFIHLQIKRGKNDLLISVVKDHQWLGADFDPVADGGRGNLES